MERSKGEVKERKCGFLGSVGTGNSIGVHNRDVATLARGVVERVFLVKNGQGGFRECPQPQPGAFTRLRALRNKIVRRCSTTSWSYQRFVDSYAGRKRTVYQNALEDLKGRGYRKSDSYLQTFVKAEKIDFTAKTDPAPRVIQPRGPVYNLLVGVHIRPLEGPLYKTLAEIFGEITVFKGMNAGEQGRLMEEKWNKFTDPVGVGIDASRFDQHVSKEALQFEHSVYNMICRDKELAKLLKQQINNRGFGRCDDGVVKYSVRGSRMSGDMNTALGNCLLMCVLVYQFFDDLGMTTRQYSLANNGDDCVLIFERENLPRVAHLGPWFLDFGFEMEIEEPVDCIEKIVFCQTQPVWTPNGYIMVRDHNTARDKDMTVLKPHYLDSEGGYDLLRGAIGDGGTAMCGKIPVFNEFYRMFQKNSRKTNSRGKKMQITEMSGFWYLTRGMKENYGIPDPRTRLSYYIAFGVTPGEQEALEDLYRTTVLQYSAPQILPWPPATSALN